LIAAAVLALAASSSFATTHTYSQATLTGADQLVDSFLATGGFSSSFTFYGVGIADAWITNGASTYHYLSSGSGTLTFPGVSVSYQSLALGGSLANGNWSVHVQGTPGNSFTGGSTFNAGNVVPSTPVPEPESYAMLLAGLGALGFIGRRRQTNKA
jgi:PEP-CTERM motif